MHLMLERLAVWYLNRQGHTVLPLTFIGFAVGYGNVIKKDSDAYYDHWEMWVPKCGRIIALNNSVVQT